MYFLHKYEHYQMIEQRSKDISPFCYTGKLMPLYVLIYMHACMHLNVCVCMKAYILILKCVYIYTS